MRTYEVEFFDVKKGLLYYVYDETNENVIYLGEKYILLVKETDLEKIKNYGKGIKSLKYIGELYTHEDNKIENTPITFNITINNENKVKTDLLINEMSKAIKNMK